MIMSEPHVHPPGHTVPLKEVAPRPAQRKPTLILILIVAIAWVLQGLGLLTYILVTNHQRDTKSSQRDVEHTQTERQLATANANIAQLQHQLVVQQDATAALSNKLHDSLCAVAITLHNREPDDTIVTQFGQANGCFK